MKVDGKKAWPREIQNRPAPDEDFGSPFQVLTTLYICRTRSPGVQSELAGGRQLLHWLTPEHLTLPQHFA